MAVNGYILCFLLCMNTLVAPSSAQMYPSWQVASDTVDTTRLKNAISSEVDRLLQNFKRQQSEDIAAQKKNYDTEVKAIRSMYAKDLEWRDTRIAQLEKMNKTNCNQTKDDKISMVAFTAQVDSLIASTKEDTRVPFHDINLNLGKAFTPTSFHTPLSGVYSFSFEVAPDPSCQNNRLCVGLYRSSVLLSTSCCRWPNSCGTSVNTHLDIGSEVWLTIIANASSCYKLTSGGQYNKFTGNLIIAD